MRIQANTIRMNTSISLKIISFLMALSIVLIPAILFVRTIQHTLNAIAPANRKMTQVSAWLVLVPIIGTIWSFFMAKYLSKSIQLELECRNLKMSASKNPTYPIGLILSFSSACSNLPFDINYFSYLSIICFFIYWRQILHYKKLFTDKN